MTMMGLFTFGYSGSFYGHVLGVVNKAICLAVLLLSSALAEVFTSSEKLERLAEREVSLMARLQSYHDRELDVPLYFARREQDFSQLPLKKYLDLSLHPNGAYLLLKAFVHVWPAIIASDPAFWSLYSDLNCELPTQIDLEGISSAMLRLQMVYGLTVVDMYAGNYSGFVGPRLSPSDAYQLGRQAYVDGLLRECIAWLEFTRTEHRRGDIGVLLWNRTEVTGGTDSVTSVAGSPDVPTAQERVAVLSLLGRAHFHVGHKEKARSLYERSMKIDPSYGDVLQLGKELQGIFHQKRIYENQNWHQRLNVLCSRSKHQRVDKIRHFHRCRYRRSLSCPFLRYKQEIVSLSPFISLVHDAISRREIKAFKQHVTGKMVRGRVQNRKGTEFVVSHERISEMGWIHDSENELVSAMSQRVKDLTWLEVEERLPDGPSASEGFQVINYGLGGHHNSHYDPVQVIDNKALEHSGNRLATVVIYLTDVDIGGHTVFLRTGVSIAPVKGMAAFWYNYTPALRMDLLTLHAGCPVLKGHKWIANKWIWFHGNIFHRPCGATPRASHAYVERTMMSPRLT